MSGEDAVETPTVNKQAPKLNIYVYAPGQAVPTRANEGEVDADPEEAENAIHTLQIWVYTHNKCDENFVEVEEDEAGGDYKLVTYFKTNAFQQDPENPDQTYKFELPINEDYAEKESRPTVDVYVLANVTPLSCGLDFDENTTRDQLEAASLKYDGTDATNVKDYFGLTAPVTEVPFEGLPMSGVLRNQKVSGSSPILTLGSSESMARVKLARAVSRIRFVFSCSSDFDGLKINSVTLDNGMIPNEEYLFLTDEKNPYGYKDNDFHIVKDGDDETDNEYNSTSPSLFSLAATAQCEDPAHYAWDRLVNDEMEKNPDITPQELVVKYEALIKEGLSTDVEPTYSSDTPQTLIDPGHVDPRLTECRLYLRESDKQLKGTIRYQVKEKGADEYGDELTIPFSMAADGDFSRNHTWIVYSYLSWAKIHVVAVTIKPWTEATGEHELYNW